MLRADPNRIGNARQQNDNLIAVSDAILLGECFQDVEAFLLGGHDVPPPGTAEPAEVYGKRVAAMFGAGNLLRRSVSEGSLRLWRIHNGSEVQIAPMDLDQDNIRNGVFKTLRRPEPDMQGALLWVKSADWSAFRSRLQQALPSQQSQRAKGGRPRIMEKVREELKRLYPDPTVRDQVPAKEAVRRLGDVGIRVSETTVKRSKRQEKKTRT